MIERHVCSLELSRKLAEAGFPQECVFAWQPRAWGESEVMLNDDAPCPECAAPLISEIMEQMPGNVEVSILRIPDGSIVWRVSHPDMEDVYGDPGPDAAGALWLALRGEK